MKSKKKEFASLTVNLDWKLIFGFPKKEMGTQRYPPFFSAKPVCSLRFPITSHTGKTDPTYDGNLNNQNANFIKLKI